MEDTNETRLSTYEIIAYVISVLLSMDLIVFSVAFDAQITLHDFPPEYVPILSCFNDVMSCILIAMFLSLFIAMFLRKRRKLSASLPLFPF